MDKVTAALRYSTVEIEPFGPLAQALFLVGVIFLLLLFVGFVFWRVRRTSRNR